MTSFSLISTSWTTTVLTMPLLSSYFPPTTVELTDREKERRDKKRALALKKKAKELAEVAFVEATAAAAATSSLPVK